MEKFGLVNALKFLADNSLQVSTLVTDRHKQISKNVTEVQLGIEHRYDVWYISKSMFTYIYLYFANDNEFFW